METSKIFTQSRFLPFSGETVYVSSFFIVIANNVDNQLNYKFGNNYYNKAEILEQARLYHNVYQLLKQKDYDRFRTWIKYIEREFILEQILN